MELREEVAREIMLAECCGLTRNGERVFCDECDCMEAADAAIAIVLRKVEQHLSAVQYDPSPYTSLKHRLADLTPTR
jgi:hypothetical protein